MTKLSMLKKILISIGILAALGLTSVVLVIRHVRSSLPPILKISDYEPLMVSQVFDRNGKKIGEFFRERRILVPYKEMPKLLVQSFLAAEDDQFFEHGGINYLAILRATLANLRAGHTVQGGSTITQQVAKTFFLSNEKTVLRKVKEALLAQQLEDHLSKEDILYLYLNQIYFGQGAYGVEAAAETYFRKTVKTLTLPEMAILAGLPKAPSAYSPIHNPTRAKERQSYVLRRLAEIGAITKQQSEAFIQEPVKVYAREKFETYAPYFLETVRQVLKEKLSEEMVLDKGLKIYTSLDLSRQLAAQESVTAGLKSLDKRQGYRGPLKNMTDPQDIGDFLLKTRNKLISEALPERIIQPSGKFNDYGPMDFNRGRENGKTQTIPYYLKKNQTTEAIVTKVDDELGLVTVRMAEIQGLIDFESMQWARKPDGEKRYDLDLIKKPSQALKPGDVILAKLVSEKFESDRLKNYFKKNKAPADKPWPDVSTYYHMALDQEPIAEAALLSLDQSTQDVLAMIGGYKFERSEYNRALQAARQTGSSFKAIVYASSLDKGYTAATPIMDAPIVFEEQSKDEGQEDTKSWKPSNHEKRFGGDIILRNALVQSLNIPAVKVLEDLGVDWAATYARRLGIYNPLNMDFTLALGSSGITLYEMTRAFSIFGRLGKKSRPILVHKVEDATGKTLVQNIELDEMFTKAQAEINQKMEERRTAYLQATSPNPPTTDAQGNPIPVPAKPIDYSKRPEPNLFFEDPDQLIKPQTAYLMTSLLKGVVEDKHGTGQRARALGREVAGKTGTTNGYFDAWFIGYTSQIATGVWVGFDHEKTLGKGEVGGRAALPIWLDYMKDAHESLPITTFPIPQGIVFANIDGETGQLASATSKNVIRQAFAEGTEPTGHRNKKDEETDFYKEDLSE